MTNMEDQRTLIVIPARAGSTRFPLKMLQNIHGRPMLYHVWSLTQKCKNIDSVVIATDDDRIFDAAKSWGAVCIMTSKDIASGTDRAAVVNRELQFPIVINVQGDEPTLNPADIDALAGVLKTNRGCAMATLGVWQKIEQGYSDPNVVKIVTDGTGHALYFSRAPIPYGAGEKFLKHIGIYGFQNVMLQKFCELKPSTLEKAERLEQLRALENNIQIQVVIIQSDTVSVDVPSDIVKVETFLNQKLES